jgi:hypothetical protein
MVFKAGVEPAIGLNCKNAVSRAQISTIRAVAEQQALDQGAGLSTNAVPLNAGAQAV